MSVVLLRRVFRVSERRAWQVVDMPRCSCRYRSRRKEIPGLGMRLLELAAGRMRFGPPRLHLLLRWEGFMVNHKRVERIYIEKGLWVRKRTRKRMKGAPRLALQPSMRPNKQWAMDFVSDALTEERAIRTLNVLDVFAQEGLAIESGLQPAEPAGGPGN